MAFENISNVYIIQGARVKYTARSLADVLLDGLAFVRTASERERERERERAEIGAKRECRDPLNRCMIYCCCEICRSEIGAALELHNNGGGAVVVVLLL